MSKGARHGNSPAELAGARRMGCATKASWADPATRARRLAGMRAAAARELERGGPAVDTPYQVHGGRVSVAAIPRDPIEAELFGDAAA